MKTQTLAIVVGVSFLAARAGAQSVLFDFENAPRQTSLPISLTVGGITTQFYSAGLGGFSVQWANTYGFTPPGFSGLCLFPNGIDAADLHAGFSTTLTDFAILYSPQELGCDASATMRVTAYLDDVFVGTATTNASAPGTWPSEWLRFNSGRFNSVVVHYDKAPACGDYGMIFMADNMTVTPAPPPIVLTGMTKLPDGAFQFGFTNLPGLSFTVLSTTNLSVLFRDWMPLGGVTELAGGQYQFTDPQATNGAGRFYRVQQP